MHPSGVQKDGSRKVLNLDCTDDDYYDDDYDNDDEEEDFSHILIRPNPSKSLF